MTFGISLCMIVQNEEDRLERCLSSVSSIVSEIIIVDTGSTDKSQEIAKRFGALVIEFPWEDDFAKARNEGLKHAKNNWILVLDADEELEEPDFTYLNRLLQQKDVYGYFVKIKNYVGTLSSGEHVTDSVCRLFRNHPDIYFTSSIHEEVTPTLLTIPNARIEFSEITVRHYGYLEEVIHRKKKNERNLRMIQGALKRAPQDLRLLYALGTEYFQQEKYAVALAVFESILPRVPVFSGYDSDLLLKTAYAMRETERRQEALQMIEEALLFYPDFTDLLELKALILMDLGKDQDAYGVLSQAIQTGDVSYKYTSSSGSGTYRSHYLAGFICEHLYLWEEAKKHYYEALLHHPAYLPIWSRLPTLSFLLGATEELLTFLAEHRRKIPETAWNLIIQTAVNGWETDFAIRLLRCQGVSKLSDPILEGVLLIQRQHGQEAKKLWNSGGIGLRHLYLWALAIKENDILSAMHHLKQLCIHDSSFLPLEGTMNGDGALNISETVCRMCQQALLQVGAWGGLIWFQSNIPPSVTWSWMPSYFIYGLLKAPSSIKNQYIQLCKEKQGKLTYSEMLSAGLFAYDCGKYHEAYLWFVKTHEQFPNRIAPMIGLLHLYEAQAHLVSHHPILPPVKDLRFLTLYE